MDGDPTLFETLVDEEKGVLEEGAHVRGLLPLWGGAVEAQHPLHDVDEALDLLGGDDEIAVAFLLAGVRVE
jgi:hypothetical protein